MPQRRKLCRHFRKLSLALPSTCKSSSVLFGLDPEPQNRLEHVEGERDKLEKALQAKSVAMSRLVAQHRQYVMEQQPVAQQLADLQAKVMTDFHLFQLWTFRL